MRRTLRLFAFLPLATCMVAQQPSTSPDNETRTPGTIRSANSIGSDLAVPLCPARFHDSLRANGIAGPQDQDVTRPRVKSIISALMTQQAIDAAGQTHIGNFNVILNVAVDKKGLPHDVCLQKSSGYGLDASAAAAVERYRFTPARKNGKPVRARVPVTVRFESPNPPPIGLPRTGEPPT